MIETSETMELAGSRLPADGGEAIVEPLEKGGSDRKFYRARNGSGSMIFIRYSGAKEENRHYVDIARFLKGAGVPVPEVFEHDGGNGHIWMQDMGTEDLWGFRGEPWETRRPLYESALRAVRAMHTAAARTGGHGLPKLERVFDSGLYRWERDYFFENCLGGFFKIPRNEVEALASLPALEAAGEMLAGLPRSLVHRDFQSQNIMVMGGAAWLIDFQGMRFGLPQYDLASLLYDPYVEISGAERVALLEFYKSLAAQDGPVPPDFDEVFGWCALQRLMQALGAYGFLGIQKNRPNFLSHIPAAMRSLREVASGLDGLGPLVQKIDSLPWTKAAKP